MRLPSFPDRLWIVVAHEAGARIFARESDRGPLVVVDRVDWPIGRAKNREINSDRPGREADWGPSKQRHGLDQPVLPTEKNALELAREIAKKLDNAANLDRYDHLVLVAGPKFLGLLRQALGAPASTRLALTLNENLGTTEDREIPVKLRSFLAEYERTRPYRDAG